MHELDLQDKYLLHFLCERTDGLQYKEAKANTVSRHFFILEDLLTFISETSLNKDNYKKLLRKFQNNEKELLEKFADFLDEKISASKNMAIFLNTYKSITFEGIKLHLFYPSGMVTKEDANFDENIFSVVQELPYNFKIEGKQIFSFRPDLSFFLNGFYLGYTELKSNWNNQTARTNGRKKVQRDYLAAVQAYLTVAKQNDLSEKIRNQFLKIFEKAIHITSTDIKDTYIIRNISSLFPEIKNAVTKQDFHFQEYEKQFLNYFKPYPVSDKQKDKFEQFEEIFKALYDKRMIEKEILYYNFLERDLVKKEEGKGKEYKHNDGRLISPRPKQKFGTDKIVAKMGEFLAHEEEAEYIVQKLEKELVAKGVGEAQIKELIQKRQKFQNNKNVYSLLLQYAAGFGKSNIIGWTALQLKDLRLKGEFVYDKVMLVVDRLQLRDQLDTMLQNMNIQKAMFTEATDRKSFLAALSSEKRIVVVNVQKFVGVKDILDSSVVAKLQNMRIVFLIDEIHRSNSGTQHESMISLFDELQASFDNNSIYTQNRKKKNVIIGFTATPSEHSLARFGEFSRYADNLPLWVPFDYYTMKEAIQDNYILNPLDKIVPVPAKMFFELPEDSLAGFEQDYGYELTPEDLDTGIDEEGKKYVIRKKTIYANPDRIDAIAKFVVERLVKAVYHNIRGTAKAMLAVSSIPNAIRYKHKIKQYFEEITADKKYENFKKAPIYIVYSDSQGLKKASSLNENKSEEKVIQEFKNEKNGLIIVVDKLQTGFDEPKLHTLFLDKEIRGINAIQTISRVNRTTKNKHDCKIIDFSYKNVNVSNIKAAFEHFSNVVVSNFDPLGNEEKLAIYYEQLKKHFLYLQHFAAFVKYENGDKESIEPILAIERDFENYFKISPEDAKQLKQTINQYFSILSLIENVIQIEAWFRDKDFLEFWRKYNTLYNKNNQSGEYIDEVEVYFDNKIGLIEPANYDIKLKIKQKSISESENAYDNSFKYNILKVIQKRNEEEEAIEELIKDFELKIDAFFDYTWKDSDGKRLIAKIKDEHNAFSQEDIYTDFAKIHRKYVITRREALGAFFPKETKDILTQLCDDFEKWVTAK